MIEISTPTFPVRWLACLTLLLLPAPGYAEDSAWKPVLQGDPTSWPAWRGPLGDGLSEAKNVPTKWSATENLAWQTPLAGWGDSTPAIVGDHVFLTLQNDANELRLLRLDAATGQVELNILVDNAETPREAPRRSSQKFHNLHNMASPSPVVSGDSVVVHFGNGLLATYSLDGEERWRHNLQSEYGEYTIWWGHANSPVVFDGMVISVCMQDSLADLRKNPVESYVVAHDLKTGERRWFTKRMPEGTAEELDAYTTPLLVQKDGHTQIIIMGGNALDAYDPQTGQQLWHLPKLVGGRTVTGPVLGDGTIFTTRGMRKPLLAVKLAEFKGLVPEEAIEWTVEKTTPDTPSPVFVDGMLFTVTDDGIANCYNAETGDLHWRERLGGNFKASPVAADGKIYFINIDGKCTVVAAKTEFEEVAVNQLNDTTIASPAIAYGKLFIRGKKSLYCIGN